jgi:hypothetical protein
MQPISNRRVEWVINDELENILKEIVEAQSRNRIWIPLDRLTRITKVFKLTAAPAEFQTKDIQDMSR